MATLSFLHTAAMHVPMFHALVEESAPALTQRHHVDAGLLANARQGGLGSVHRALKDALDEAAAGADLVVCTCSTLGEPAEQLSEVAGVPVLRVDRPMAEVAVRLQRPIVVVAALESTVEPTMRLLAGCAAGSPIDVRVAPHFDAWRLFEADDVTGFYAEIARHVRVSAQPDDVVVLAQASMAPVVDLLDDLEADVLASPPLAVAEAAHRLAGTRFR